MILHEIWIFLFILWRMKAVKKRIFVCSARNSYNTPDLVILKWFWEYFKASQCSNTILKPQIIGTQILCYFYLVETQSTAVGCSKSCCRGVGESLRKLSNEIFLPRHHTRLVKEKHTSTQCTVQWMCFSKRIEYLTYISSEPNIRGVMYFYYWNVI